MNLEPWHVLSFAGLLFSIGLCGIALRRNLLVMIMCIELMLNSVNLVFVTFSRIHQNVDGQMSVLFIMTVAAVESAIGLGLLIALYRNLRTVQSDEIQMLRN